MKLTEAHNFDFINLKDFVDAYPLPFVILTPIIKDSKISDFIFEYANIAAANSNNISVQEFVGKNLLDIHPIHHDNGVFQGLCEVYNKDITWSKSVGYTGPSGSSLISGYFTIHANRKNGFIVVGWAEFTDIKLAEESLRKSGEELKASLKEKEMLVKEKEMLIRESHHRIKNNLQLISSLMRLQMNERNDIDSDFFRTIENKIYSISLLHEHLYQRTSLSSVNLGSYLTELIKYLVSTNQNERISLEIDLDDIEIETDRAVNIGLIVNELITNSIKHAFRGIKNGIITVKLKAGAEKIVLTVADNGSGFPAGFTISESKSLGLQLVNMMTEQLPAKLSISSGTGTSYELLINI